MFEHNLKIHHYSYLRDIAPWLQNNLMTPYWRFYWNEVPGGCLRCQHREIELGPDVFTVIPGYLKFSTFARAPFHQFYIHFGLNEQLVLPGKQIWQIPADPQIVREIKAFIATGDKPEHELMRSIMSYRILAGALLELPREVLTPPPRLDERIVRVCEYIDKNLHQAPGNDQLAALLRLNRNSFVRLFAQTVGETPQQYIRRKRIERACEYLHFSNQSIEEIAATLGFADRFHFSRIFRQVMMTPPARFRATQK